MLMEKGGEMAKIETVGIVGFGVMGAAIGLNAASSGYRVIYKELNDDWCVPCMTDG
jgi:3-hydroxyacyl-CoA dehydrogenase